MIKPNLIGIADIEKLNASELNNVKGGASSFAQENKLNLQCHLL